MITTILFRLEDKHRQKSKNKFHTRFIFVIMMDLNSCFTTAWVNYTDDQLLQWMLVEHQKYIKIFDNDTSLMYLNSDDAVMVWEYDGPDGSPAVELHLSIGEVRERIVNLSNRMFDMSYANEKARLLAIKSEKEDMLDFIKQFKEYMKYMAVDEFGSLDNLHKDNECTRKCWFNTCFRKWIKT